MARSSTLWILFVLGIFSKGASAVIQTQQTVVAAVGEKASLECQLTQSRDVLQVTWQRILPDGEKNLATYSKNFGSRVNHDLNEKVDFHSDLKNCSMVIRKVRKEDEGCYRCLFNTFPKGAVTGRTCLKLYELHGPVLHVRESTSSAEPVVSCSATGRPAPNVTLTVTQQHLSFSHHNTVSVHNTNGTVTVTATAGLSGFCGNGAQVGCAAGVLSGPRMETFVMIPELKETSDDCVSRMLQPDDSEFNYTWITLSVVIVVLACCVVCFVVVCKVKLKQKHKNGDIERSKTPQKTTRDETRIITPLIRKMDEIRQRMSDKKSPEDNRPQPSPSAAKRLFI